MILSVNFYNIQDKPTLTELGKNMVEYHHAEKNLPAQKKEKKQKAWIHA